MQRGKLGLVLWASTWIIACSGSFKPGHQVLSSPPFTESKVEIIASSIEKGASFSFITGENQYRDVILPVGTKLTLVMDLDCARVNPQSLTEFSLTLPNQHETMTLYSREWTLPKDTSSRELKAQLDNNPCVVGASESGEVFLAEVNSPDPRRRFQKHFDATQLEEGLTLFHNPKLPPLHEVVIAVIDSGVDHEHEDLQGRMWTNKRGEYGYNFYDDNTDATDDNGHGTFVAGEIAAQNDNGIGVFSPAGRHGKIMAIKALGGKGHPRGSHESIANSVFYAADNGADIINMSLGGWGFSRTQQLAVNYALQKGVFIAAAAGNDFSEISWSNTYSPAIFGALNSGMLAVGAISLTDNQKASFSNYSSEIIQVAAPGSSGVYSITPGNTYGVKEGTSMATPLISGAAALVIGFLKARGEEVTPALVERLILEGSDRAEHLTPYFQEGRTLNYLSLARKIQAEYRVRQVQLPASDGLQIDAGITSSFLLNRDSVEVQGYLCNRQLEPDARVLVQTGSEMEEIPVTWDYNFAWKGECFLGNVVQHVFSGVHPVAAQKANYYLQVGSNPPKLLPRVY